MKMKKSRLIMAVCMASFALLIAAGGLLFRFNNFKIEFSVPTGETDTVETWISAEGKPDEEIAFVLNC
ncbi:MAG: hypothetical protein IKN39_02560, partial [Clostridia bacterium]|nr:hypothetical protein [Clostridia bacterium]